VDTSLVLQDDAPGTIAAALWRLASDSAGLRWLGARARTLAAERYDWERVVDQLESVCAEVSPACA
jgi:glycosyltransferase involved in cell wall biosynthesis